MESQKQKLTSVGTWAMQKLFIISLPPSGQNQRYLRGQERGKKKKRGKKEKENTHQSKQPKTEDLNRPFLHISNWHAKDSQNQILCFQTTLNNIAEKTFIPHTEHRVLDQGTRVEGKGNFPEQSLPMQYHFWFQYKHQLPSRSKETHSEVFRNIILEISWKYLGWDKDSKESKLSALLSRSSCSQKNSGYCTMVDTTLQQSWCIIHTAPWHS